MTGQVDLLNNATLDISNPSINDVIDVDCKLSMNATAAETISANVGIISVASAVSILITVKAEVSYIEPNDFVNSCFGGGYWEEDYGWSESDCWAE